MRLIFALLLSLWSANSAFAASCSPIPALPDTERRSQYSISGSTGPLNVGFQIYGDGTDFGNWIGVYIGGVLQDPSTYTVTSPTTTLATGCRPITDAQVTFNTAQTGTVQIVGAQRPRRLSQVAENRGVSAHDFNQLQSGLTAMERERWDQLMRAIQAPPGETLSILPPAATRAGNLLGFDGSGQPLIYPLSNGVGPQGPAGAAGAAGTSACMSNTRLAKTANYSVANGDAGATIAMGGGSLFTLTLNAPSGYSSSFCILALNEDSVRAKNVVISGGTTFRLYPGQSATIYNQNNVWQVIRPNRWKLAAATTLYFDATNGNNSNDCLAAGAGNACATPQYVWDLALSDIDVAGQVITFQSAAGQTYTNAGINTSHGLVGALAPQYVIFDFAGSTVFTNNGIAPIEIGAGAAPAGTAFLLQNVVLSSSVSLIENFGGVLLLGPGVNFGISSTGSQVRAGHPGAIVFFLNNFTISGNAGLSWLDAQTGALIVTHGLTATCAGVTAYGASIVSAFGTSNIYMGGMTFSGCGGVLGTRWSASQLGNIDVSGGGAAYIFGSVNGVATTGGQYN